MIPANKLKEISGNIHAPIGDSDPLPPVKPLIIGLILIAVIYVLVVYF